MSGSKHLHMEWGQVVAIRFSWFAVWMSDDIMHAGGPPNFSEWPRQQQTQRRLSKHEVLWQFLWSLYQVIQSVGLRGKEQLLFLVIPSQKVGRKLESLFWSIITRYWRKLVEFRIQFSSQVNNKISKTMNSTRAWYLQRCAIETVFLFKITLFSH